MHVPLNTLRPERGYICIKPIHYLMRMSCVDLSAQSRIPGALCKSVVLFCGQVFHKPMSESGRLNDAEMEMIFVNWNELLTCNSKLLK